MSKEVVKKYPAGEPWGPMAEYVVVRIPDKMLLASLINKARGNRTMAQLADACNVSASTLSRAVNGKITKPMSLDLIQRIAENAETKEHELFERIARANGYVTKDEYESGINTGVYTIFETIGDSMDVVNVIEFHEYGRKISNVVMTELLKRGIPVKLLDYQASQIASKSSFKINYSFQIETNLGCGNIIWSFFNLEPASLEYGYDIERQNREFIILKERVLNNVASWFVLDTWESEKLDNRLYTLLSHDKNLCLYFQSLFTWQKVNNDFSFVAVDIDKECVNFEAYMERKDGQEHELIFDRPVIDSENYSETWPKHKNQGGK